MEVFIENIIIYGFISILLIVVFGVYFYKLRKRSRVVEEKIEIAKRDGLHEPVSLHPVVDPNSCIGSGACILACPEKDILGIRNGRATIINASQCIGHGACFHACPTQAITLYIGVEKRGVELPHVSQNFETNVKGIYIAGEMGGMGLIKNAVEQGRQAVENLAKTIRRNPQAENDLVIVGAGPAGIAATLTAKKLNLKAVTLEQDSLGGTVFTFPRAKIVMTAPMDLPLYGKVKLYETSKAELLSLWQTVLQENNLVVHEHKKVESIINENNHFIVEVKDGSKYTAQNVVLAVGRRGTPRKLNIPGEESEKVTYRLLDPELISGKNIIVVGGGDSAIESALLLANQNNVTLSYRKDTFSRLKPKNSERIKTAIDAQEINAILNSNLTLIEKEFVTLKKWGEESEIRIENDLVYIFAGGELPTQFLKSVGITITKRFGEVVLKHEKK
ncbi:Thioredoxin reductase [hydrothermal vent metagenome]|uniref:Thioredoxin reductase n=1 Tax=hydrothermal vent metagenome TaxID=652676 RepID=A0A3B0TJ53_9ZZZZ